LAQSAAIIKVFPLPGHMRSGSELRLLAWRSPDWCRKQDGALPSSGPVMASGVTAGERLGPKLLISVMGGWILLTLRHY
jgi:hypothetical protein